MTQTTEKEPFYKLSKVLLRASKIEYKGQDGVPVVEDLTLSSKIVYTHMLDQYTRFSTQNKEYFQTQETLALEISLSLSTVKRSIHQLELAKLVSVTRKRSIDKKKNKYIVYGMNSVCGIRLFSDLYEQQCGNGWFWESAKLSTKVSTTNTTMVLKATTQTTQEDVDLWNVFAEEDEDWVPF